MGNGESQPAENHQREDGEIDEEEELEPEEEEQEQQQQKAAHSGSDPDAAVERMNAVMETQDAAAANKVATMTTTQPQAVAAPTAAKPQPTQSQPTQPQKQAQPTAATQQPKPAQPAQIAAPQKAATAQPQPLAPLSKPLSPLRQPLPPPQQQPEGVTLTTLKPAAAASPAAAVAVAPTKAAVAAPVSSVSVVSPSVPARPPPGATTEAEDDNPPEGSPEPAARLSSDRSGVGEEHLDLWYALVEWVSEARVLDTGVVLAWDSEEVGARVLGLTTDRRLMDTLAIKQAERKRARIAAMRAEQAKKRGEQNEAAAHELQPLSSPATASASASSSTGYKHALPPLPEGVSIPYALAEELLVVDRSLAQLRHTWVPSRVSEDTFWTAYFSAILRTIREHVLALQQPDDQLQETNPALERMQQKPGAQQVLDEIIRKQIDKECHGAER